MAISFESETREDCLFVSAKGYDENLQDAAHYARGVLGTALQSGCSRVLCDEREVQYSLSTIDTYQLAEAASIEAKKLKKLLSSAIGNTSIMANSTKP